MLIGVMAPGLVYSCAFIPENFLPIFMKINISNGKIRNNVRVRMDESVKYLKRGGSRAGWSDAHNFDSLS